jgi:hypothetical protein
MLNILNHLHLIKSKLHFVLESASFIINRMVMEYKFSQMDPDKMMDLFFLYKRVFGGESTINCLIHKYLVPHWKMGYIGYISYTVENEPASYYGVLPTQIIIGGRVLWSSQSGDTMTSPGHVGKGLFLVGAKNTYELAEKKGITSVFGFPSEASQRGFEKLGWSYSYLMRRIRFKIWTIPIIFLSRKFNLVNKLHGFWFRFICSFLPKGEEFSGHILDFGYDGVLRDADMWKYKLKNRNIKLIKINGLSCSLKFDGGKLIIGDIDIRNKSISHFFYIQIYIISLLSFSSIVDYYSSPDDELLNMLKIYGEEAEVLPYGWISFAQTLSLKNMRFSSFDFDTY